MSHGNCVYACCACKVYLMSLLRVALGAAIAFGIDRLSKFWIVHWLDLASVHRIEVLPPYLVFQMAWNRGINFGLFKDFDSRWALIALAVLISVALTTWVRNKRSWLQSLTVGVIIGGALGNAFDRLMYGAVADYLNMSCCGLTNPSSFNVADVFIVGGLLLLMISNRNESRSVSTDLRKQK